VAENLAYCFLCQVSVKRRSKHCKVCKKCVDEFDHHCVWLNNCVGVRNYSLFLFSIGSTCAFVTVQLCGAAAALAVISSNDTESGWPAVAARLKERTSFQLGRETHGVLVGVLLVANIPVWALITQLCAFHVQLRREGLTTYDYILREQVR